MTQFVHLHVHSCYSLLDGAADLEELVRAAAEHGMPAVAVTDHNSLAAAVKFSSHCENYGVKPIFGAEITMADGTHLTLLAQTPVGYTNLCTLISKAYEHGGRLLPLLPWKELPNYAEGLICLTGCRSSLVCQLLRGGRFAAAQRAVEKLQTWFGSQSVYVELIDDRTPGSRNRCMHLVELARFIGAPVVATNNVHYVRQESYRLHQVLRCIKEGTTFADDVYADHPYNRMRHFRSAKEMETLFDWCPEAIANTLKIAESCTCMLPRFDQVTPECTRLPGKLSAAEFLRELAYKGAAERYGSLSDAVCERIEHELKIINDLDFDSYFLLAWQVVDWSRSKKIRCSGRGSAADSIVAYALRLTDVDVIARELPFARFLAPGKTPDIDLDFQHDRRDEVFEYLKRTFGEANVAAVCTHFTYWARGAIRDVGKVLGLPDDLLEVLRTHVSGYVAADQIKEAFAQHPELQHHQHLLERCTLLFDLCQQIAGFPRHLSTHSSGVIISRCAVSTIAPTLPTARGVLNVMMLDKEDAADIGLVKLDILCLRIISAIEDTVQSISARDASFDYDAIKLMDSEAMQMIRAGKAFGVFQLESPAQMHLALMLHPQLFEDLVASIALIRPGPISSGVVQRYILARNGYKRVECLHPVLEPVLWRTYGCVVYQEQVIQVISVVTSWSEAAADRYRKRLTRHHQMGTMDEARKEFIEAALAHLQDLPIPNAETLFVEIQGWAGLGFAESHAASFAIHAAKSAYLSVHHVAEYTAGLLSSQPMGFWPSNSLVAEARRRGVTTRMVDINLSDDKCTVEDEGVLDEVSDSPDKRPHLAIRLGLRMVAGLGSADIQAILDARRISGPFQSLLEFAVRVPIKRDLVEALVLCGAFDELHEHRRGLLWRLDETIALAHALRAEAGDNQQMRLELGHSFWTPVAWELEDLSPWDKLMWEWRITGVCAGSHPLTWIRERLTSQGIVSAAEAANQPDGAIVTVAGLNIRPHRPPRKGGGRHLFTSIEDETDVLQASFYGDAIDKCAPVILLSPVIIATGRIKKVGDGVNFEVEHVEPLTVKKSPINAPRRVFAYNSHARTHAL